MRKHKFTKKNALLSYQNGYNGMVTMELGSISIPLYQLYFISSFNFIDSFVGRRFTSFTKRVNRNLK